MHRVRHAIRAGICTTAAAVLVIGAGLRMRSIVPNAPVHAATARLAPGGNPRDYGWNQLAMLLSPDSSLAGQSGPSDWSYWSNKCSLASGLRPPAGGDQQIFLSSDCNLPLRAPFTGMRLSTQNPDPQKIRLGSVYFNGLAAMTILGNHLDIPGDGDRDPLTPSPGPAIDIAPFPVGSVVVKAVWELVDIGKAGGKQVAQFHFYNPNLVQPIAGNQLPPMSQWNAAMLTIDVNDSSCPYRQGETIPAKSLVPRGCFVVAHTSISDYTIGHKGVLSCGGSCLYVLVGLHVAHKEQNAPRQWTWTTFWWTNDPTNAATAPFIRDAPGNVPPAYNHFAMDTSVANGGAMYNPYQEGSEGPGALSSRCAGCHGYAMVQRGQNGKLMPVPHAPQNSSGSGPATCLPGKVCTDAMWSIADSRDPSAAQIIMANRRMRPSPPRQKP